MIFSTPYVSLALLHLSTLSYAASPTLDLNNAQELSSACSSSLQVLQSYYSPNALGVFDQVETPWFESGVIWGMYFDHLKWSGDGKFINTVGNALANASFNDQQDFLDGAQAPLQETLSGKWNDDILWPAQAVIAGVEVFGLSAIQPGSGGGKWITTAQKTFDQAYQQWDPECGGGIYWSRDRSSVSAKYKSVITNLEFISQGARIFLQTKNQTALDLAQNTLNWVIASGLANPSSGMIYDGFNAGACTTFTASQWTYNYGEMLGALSWMHAATGNTTFLTIATPFLNNAILTFTGASNGVIVEQCEPTVTCHRDQQGFKAILVRNLAYLWRETSDPSIKTSIQNVIDSSVTAMVKNSCDTDWNCGGNWTTDNGPAKNPRSQHVSSALLVAALGIHTSSTGSGLLTDIDSTTLSTTPSGTGANNYDPEAVQPGMVESRPLNGVSKGLKIDWIIMGAVLFTGLIIIS